MNFTHNIVQKQNDKNEEMFFRYIVANMDINDKNMSFIRTNMIDILNIIEKIKKENPDVIIPFHMSLLQKKIILNFLLVHNKEILNISEEDKTILAEITTQYKEQLNDLDKILIKKILNLQHEIK